MEKGSREEEVRQGGMTPEEKAGLAVEVGERCFAFLGPLLRRLDAHADVRLVCTLASLVPLIVQRRNRGEALLLSQLGDDLDDGEKAGAGTKRVDRPLHRGPGGRGRWRVSCWTGRRRWRTPRRASCRRGGCC